MVDGGCRRVALSMVGDRNHFISCGEADRRETHDVLHWRSMMGLSRPAFVLRESARKM